MEQTLMQINKSQYDDDLRIHTNMATQALEISKGIFTESQYKMACDTVIQVDRMLKAWESKIAPSIQTAHQLHKMLNDLKNEIGAPLRKARVELLQPAIMKWEASERERARVEQERINRERQKLEEERRLELAAEMEKSGKKEEAEALIEEPIHATEVVLPSTTAHRGIQYRTVYSAEVFDIKALCRAVADGHAPAEYVHANMPVLNSLARSLKESVGPQWEKYGLRVKSEKTMAVSGGY